MDPDKQKKRGRPSLCEKSNKKPKDNSNVIENMVNKVSINTSSSFAVHNDWLQENLPDSEKELFDLIIKLKPKEEVTKLEEVDDEISEKLKGLNGNYEMFSKIDEMLEDFVSDNLEEQILDVLNIYTVKVKLLAEIKEEKVRAIIRKSIGLKMFPELKEHINLNMTDA